ncbi:MAG TPA: hypothetical protein PLU50_05165, partial [Pseudobdellovibrionaceae bacterium]|nr:hypothetical protein [Pseudobdellovibrionaceae bacterium]
MREQRVWLVRTSMRVTGPLSLAELDESIRARHFTMLDEACPSLGRWRYIREIPELHAAVEVARNQEGADRDETQAQTQTQTQSKPSIDAQTDVVTSIEYEWTPTPLSNSNGRITSSTHTVTLPEPEVRKSGGSSAPKTYALRGDQSLHDRIQQDRINRLKMFSLMILILGLAFGSWTFWKQKNRSDAYANLVSQAKSLYRLRLYDRAYDVWLKAKELKSNGDDPELLLLDLVKGKKSFEVRQIFEELANQQDQSP